jgi:hypothetical protein
MDEALCAALFMCSALVASRPGGAADGGRARPAAMGAKNDLVIWLRLVPTQQHIYEARARSPANPAPRKHRAGVTRLPTL